MLWPPPRTATSSCSLRANSTARIDVGDAGAAHDQRRAGGRARRSRSRAPRRSRRRRGGSRSPRMRLGELGDRWRRPAPACCAPLWPWLSASLVGSCRKLGPPLSTTAEQRLNRGRQRRLELGDPRERTDGSPAPLGSARARGRRRAAPRSRARDRLRRARPRPACSERPGEHGRDLAAASASHAARAARTRARGRRASSAKPPEVQRACPGQPGLVVVALVDRQRPRRSAAGPPSRRPRVSASSPRLVSVVPDLARVAEPRGAARAPPRASARPASSSPVERARLPSALSATPAPQVVAELAEHARAACSSVRLRGRRSRRPSARPPRRCTARSPQPARLRTARTRQ